ncbi:MAG: pentapeptide repeat-containing protein, partial [Ilumatobacteraceae bacterium]
QADLAGVNFENSMLVGTLFNTGTIFTGAMFSNATMTNVDLRNTNLSGAVGFDGAAMTGANLSGANANSANFTGADLTNANFTNADLTSANFTNATLTGATFTGATLTGATFTGATDDPTPTTTTTTSTSSTTTTTIAPATCAEGGTCVVGDTGPGGGIVVYTSGTGSSKYMEVSRSNWYNATETAFRWCHPEYTTLVGASGTAVGTGRSNMTAMLSICTSNGAAYWINNKNNNGGVGGKTDWFLPSKDELNYVCRYARQLSESTEVCSGGTLRAGFVGASYWSSSEYNATTAWYQNFSNGGQARVDGYKQTSVYVRVVRFFGP